MEISVDFLDGRIVEYNTTSLVPSDPLKGSVSGDVTAKNYLTEYNLRLDLLETSGLRLDVYYNTISDVGLIGGGRDPKPGEISLAHNGVLFLDELPEFKRNVLEVLRQPLENGWITVSRAAGTCTFPARFILCAAMNPCPCGRGEVELGCTCKIEEKRRYQKRISGPLLDRIDLQLEVRQLSQDELLAAPDGEPSAKIRERVIRARQLQQERLGQRKLYCNAQLSSRDLQEFCRLSAGSQLLLRQAITRFKLSPRAYDRILKVARTIADLAGCVDIRDEHIFEAINYRRKEQ